MDNRTYTLSAFPFALGLPCGVWFTALGLEDGASSRFWVGLPLVVFGLAALECLPRLEAVIRAESPKAGSSVFVLSLVAIVLLQFITVSQFFLMLDGHVHFRACCWLFLVYLVGVGVVLILQRGRASG